MPKPMTSVPFERLAKFHGTNTLLAGPPGSGKTHSLISWLEVGDEMGIPLHLAVIITDPGGVETLLDQCPQHLLSRLHYAIAPQATSSWESMLSEAEKASDLTYSDLASQKGAVDPDDHRQFYDLLAIMSEFVDQHGVILGPIDRLNSFWMFGLDSLSGVNYMAKKLVVGARPVPHEGEWGVAMGLIETLITRLVGLDCFTTVTAHLDILDNMMTGAKEYIPAFLGRKLAPNMPRIFSDIISSYREGSNFFWGTVNDEFYGLKTRNVSLESSMSPTFHELYQTWLTRHEKVYEEELKQPEDDSPDPGAESDFALASIQPIPLGE